MIVAGMGWDQRSYKNTELIIVTGEKLMYKHMQRLVGLVRGDEVILF